MRDQSDATTQKCALLDAARDNAGKHYDDLFRTFIALDTKAQNTATIAGVQLGAILAFFHKGALEVLVALYGATVLAVAVFIPLLLLLVVGACVWAMKVADAPEPFDARNEIVALRSLVALPDSEFTPLTRLNHLSEHLEFWRNCVDEMTGVTSRKAESVQACQYVMLLGLHGTISLFILFILGLPR